MRRQMYVCEGKGRQEVGGVGPVPAQMWARVGPVPVQMWIGAGNDRLGCRPSGPATRRGGECGCGLAARQCAPSLLGMDAICRGRMDVICRVRHGCHLPRPAWCRVALSSRCADRRALTVARHSYSPCPYLPHAWRRGAGLDTDGRAARMPGLLDARPVFRSGPVNREREFELCYDRAAVRHAGAPTRLCAHAQQEGPDRLSLRRRLGTLVQPRHSRSPQCSLHARWLKGGKARAVKTRFWPA